MKTSKPTDWLQQLQWIFDPTNLLEKVSQEKVDFFQLRFRAAFNSFLIANPQAIQEVFNGGYQEFETGSKNTILHFILGNNSLLMLDGERHKRERKLLMPPFHGERLQGYGIIIRALAKTVMSRLGSGEKFVARRVMQEITLEVIIRVVFGLEDGDRYRQLKPLLASLSTMTDSPLKSSFLFFPFLQKDWGVWSPWGQMLHRKRRIDQLLQGEITERRNTGDFTRNDILNLLLLARDEEGKPMTDQEIKDELLTMLFAGHETTATALAWALYWVHYYPQVREKLLMELASLGKEPDPIAITKLPYLTAVCNETLRIYPVTIITTPRITKAPMQIQGREFPAKTILAPCVYLLHHREDLYPEPEQFKPERFLDRTYSPSEFIPFGGGNRRCLGYALALMELKIILATLISEFQFTLLENKPVKPQRRGITLGPAGGVKMSVS